MPIEIEAKIKVESFEAVLAALARAGAQRISRVLEVNHIFDTPQRNLFSRGCGLRVRTCAGEGRVPPGTLTYKGPQTASALKSRDELETVVEDAGATRSILRELGFAPVLVFEKRRETWHLVNCTVELDEVPRLGRYVEIEGPDEPAVANVQQSLGLGDEPIITTSYIALLLDHARTNHLPADRITFEVVQ